MSLEVRRGRYLIPGLLVLLLALPGVAGAQEEEESTAPPTETLSGVLTTVYEDPRPGLEAAPDVEYTLTEDSGRKTELLLEERDVEGATDAAALDGERVEVQASDGPGAALAVQEISPDAPQPTDRIEAQPTGTAKPTATLLCRFADSTGVTPREKPHFETLMGSTRPGLDDYWREASYGNINLSGSGVFGWYNLPNPESYYKDANGDMIRSRLTEDCTRAADADVSFPNYTNVNIMVNTFYMNYAVGGTSVVSRDGQSRVYGVTWMPRWGYQRESNVYGGQFILAHEMGHSFGLPHSSGPYGNTYDSGWDVMSDGSKCYPQDPAFGCLAAHTIAAHKDKVGWIPTDRRYAATTAPDQTLTLERLARPGASGYLEAKIPIGGSSTHFYTVEARRAAGYDDQIPADAVVIHEVDTTNATGLTPIAKVVDPDNNGDPNDAGARWLPGETFSDAANAISVEVTGETTTGYTIRINGPGAAQAPPSEATPPPADTTAPNGRVAINGGAARTSSAAVTLNLAASDDAGGTGVRQVRIRNAGRAWSTWVPYSTRKSWKLLSGTGTRTVYVQFRDGAGNVSPTARDSINKTR